jgi:hypothetical protein
MKIICAKPWTGTTIIHFKRLAGRLLAFLCLLLTFSAGAADRQVVRGHVRDEVRGLTAINRLPSTNVLHLAIGLPLRNQEALTNLLQQIYDPTSTNYHHYLTPEQFTEAFGPTEQDYQAVIAFAKANGFTITETHPNRVLLDVSGSVAQVERAFNVTMRVYHHPSEARNFFAPDVEPSLDLKVQIAHISGLDNYALPHPRVQAKSIHRQASQGEQASQNEQAGPAPSAGSGPSGTYMGNDFRAAYVPGTSLTGTGQTVGLLQFDGYTASDIAYYIATNHLPSVTLTNVLLDGFNGLPTGGGGEVEVSLDIEMVISMAPGVSKIYVYEAGPSGLWHDILNRMASDNIAKQLSCSWYIPGGSMDTVADGIFQQMALQGQSFYSASGDYDAFCGLIPFPGDTPYITEVGGTLLGTSGPGGAWTTEQTWNRYNGIGTGGGISTQYPIPTWQQGMSMTSNFGSTTMRNVPDVALTADQVYVRADGVDQNVGGTSCAAPLWAGFTALMNQQAVSNGRATVGFVNPAIYALGQSANYTATFHDITIGNNTNTGCGTTRFPAVTGYDLATGWGSPSGTLLINALAGPPDALQIAPLAGFTSSGGFGGPFSITMQTLTLTNSGTNSFTWSLSNTSLWLNVSSTSGTLTPGATVPVTVSLNSAASNLLGTFAYTATLWFTNQNTGVGQGRAFALTILGAPVISSQPVSQSTFAGLSAAFTVGAIGLAPLNYQWMFSGTNLPSATNATLSLANVTTNQAGSYYAVVSNSLGSATSSVVTLTVLSGPVFLTGNYLFLPIQTNGVFLANNTGVKFNSAGTGGASGVDFWEPGTPVYNTVVGVAGVNHMNGSAPVVSGFSSISVNNLSSGNLLRAVISGTVVPGLSFSRDVSFTTDSKVIRFVDTIQNTGTTTQPNVVVLDTADPDPDAFAPSNTTYNTLNDVVSVLQTNDMIVATGPTTGLSVGFGTESSLRIPSAVGFDNTNAYGLMTVVDPNGVSADIDINLVENYGALAPGQSQTVVWYQVFGTSKGEVLTNFSLAAPLDPLQITPSGGFSSSGGSGGPFSVTAETLTLTNAGTNSLTWSLSNTSSWLSASSVGGPLGVGASIPVTASLNSVASNLLAGSYSATIWFTNQNSGLGQGRTFNLTVLGAPVITGQPVSQSVLAGGTATFTVGAIGLAPLSYQWMFAGTALPTGMSPTLTLTTVTTNQAGNYYVVVSNSLGTATSSVVTLTVTTGPVYLTGSYLYLPIQTNGVFLANSTGVKFNAAGTGGATGVDFWEPGVPVYNTAVGVGGVTYVNGSSPVISSFTSVGVNNLSSGSLLRAVISGVVTPGLTFTRDVSFATNSKVIRIADTLQNTGSTDLPNVVLLDSADPDQDSAAPTSPTPSTLNDVVSVVQANDMVVAVGPSTGLTVGFGTESSFRIPSAVGFNNTNPYTLMTVVDPGGASADIDINLVENYGTLPAGQSQTVVWYQVFGATESEVLSNFVQVQMSDPLQIAPLNGFASSGGVGGPFSVTAGMLTLTNAGTNSLTWSLSNTSLWLSVSSIGGGLAVGGSTPVTVSLNSAASNLLAGAYSATLWFTNQSSGVGQGRTFTLTVLGAPVITGQPVSQTVSAGTTATFTVGTIGLAPLYYQWMFSGTNLPGATSATLTLPGVTTNQSGNYSVVVSNSLGTATSSVATLTVVLTPTDWFTELFSSSVITNVLAFRSFTFTPDGSANFYSVCSLPATAFFTDPAGGTVLAESDDSYIPITLSGSNTVAIYNNRSNVVYVGSNGYLTMNVGDTSLSPTYASHFSLPRVSALFRDLNPGAGGSVSWKQLSDRVAITYQAVPLFGSTTQTNTFQIELFFNGTIRITYLGLNTPTGLVGLSAGGGQPVNFVASDFSTYGCAPEPPFITGQPVNQTGIAGGNATFSVTVIGSLPLNYFWSRNGVPVSGATNASYTLNNLQLSDSGSTFSCVISNAYGITNSQLAMLTVLAVPPVITQQPANQIVGLGGSGLFSVGATGSTPLNYFWLRNNVFIAGATNPVYAVTNVQFPDSGSQFSCIVSNAFGVTNSQPGMLVVLTNLPILITFDDIAATTTGIPITNGYGGLVWSNFYALDAFDYTSPSGYQVGVVSGSNVAYNAYGGPASISQSNSFNLVSGYFTAAWVNNLQMQVVGAAAGGMTYSNNYVLSNTNRTFINFGYTGVTNVLFISSGSQVAVDNLNVGGNPGPFLLITKVTMLPGGSLQINVTGSLGSVFRVLGSTNLVNWQTVATLTNVIGFLQFTDPGTTNFSSRFYRLVTP